MKAKPRVTTISIARLYNLGNYEHIKYEIGVDVPDGASARQTFMDLLSISQRLKPLKRPFEYERAMRVLNTMEEDLTEEEKSKVEEYRAIVADFNTAKAVQLAAIKALDELGGSRKKTDTKTDWRYDDDEDVF